MDKNIIKFDDTKFKKENFIINNNPILINDVRVNEIVISNKLPIGKKDFKYFIGYKDLEPYACYFQNMKLNIYISIDKCILIKLNIHAL